MLFTRRIHEHRPVIILVVLVIVSVASLAAGARGTALRDTVGTVVSVAAYPFLRTFTGVEKGLDYLFGLVVRYNTLQAETDVLRRQSASTLLKSANRIELEAENVRLREMIEFARTRPRLELMPVEVVERFEGILVIDRGSIHGVQPSMCALTQDGVVGIVTKVEPFTANVATLYTADCKIGAMIRRNRVRGRVHGSGSDLNPVPAMQYIDLTDDVRNGDEIITSPESVFPPGIPIGRVTAVRADGLLWKSAEIQTAVPAYQLDELFIVLRAQDPAEELAGTTALPENAYASTSATDERTIQERYAP